MHYFYTLLILLSLSAISCTRENIELPAEEPSLIEDPEENNSLVDVTNPLQLIGSWTTIAYHYDQDNVLVSETDTFTTRFIEDGSFEPGNQVGWCGYPFWSKTTAWELSPSNVLKLKVENCFASTNNDIECETSYWMTSAKTNGENTELIIDLHITGNCRNDGANYKHQQLTRQ